MTPLSTAEEHLLGCDVTPKNPSLGELSDDIPFPAGQQAALPASLHTHNTTPLSTVEEDRLGGDVTSRNPSPEELKNHQIYLKTLLKKNFY